MSKTVVLNMAYQCANNGSCITRRCQIFLDCFLYRRAHPFSLFGHFEEVVGWLWLETKSSLLLCIALFEMEVCHQQHPFSGATVECPTQAVWDCGSHP